MKDLLKKVIALLLTLTISAAFTPLFGYVYAEEMEDSVISEQTEASDAEDFQASDQDEAPAAETDKAVEEREAQSSEAEQLPDNGEAVDGEELTDIVEPQNERIVPEDSADESEELYDGYLKMKAYGSRIRKTAGNRLKGANKGVYDYLNAEIAKVAAGKRSSTIFEMSAEDAFGNKNYWTAADLGLATLTDYNGNITESAVKKCQDFKAVINALLADNPYSLYWYDKTWYTQSRGFTLKLVIAAGEERLYAEGSAWYRLPVSGEYSKTKSTKTYETDTEIGQASVSIVNKAQAIVDKYEGSSDRDRLSEYGDEICRLVSYNRSAGSADYGDPWQLIWVFDGDPSTKVVCEGYSKAFKFLCDLTEFNGNVNCIIATGALGSVGHMWNVVSLDEGYNYLVDVTNSDTSAGLAEDGLFMCDSPYSGLYPEYCFYCSRIPGKYCYYTYDDDCLSTYDKSELLIPGKISEDTADKDGEEDIRIYGETRYDTAVKAAERYKSASRSKFDNVIVANGTNFPDALSGGYLAKVKNAPILLVEPDEEDRIADYIIENIMSIGTVYILGGTGVVSSAFENKIQAKGIDTERLGGSDRYETNLRILKASGITKQDILICAGSGYADSLSASAAGKPILLVGNSLTDAQKKYIKGLKKAYLIGGEGVVGLAIEKDLEVLGLTTDRLAGDDRYETSKKVAEHFFPEAKTVVLVYALNFPDGLSGGPLAIQEGAPIILTDSSTTNTKWARLYVKSAKAFRSITLGGPTYVSYEAVERIMGR